MILGAVCLPAGLVVADVHTADVPELLAVPGSGAPATLGVGARLSGVEPEADGPPAEGGDQFALFYINFKIDFGF